MPNSGTPLARIAGSMLGASSTKVLSGPPDRISAAGARDDSALHGVSNGTISQYAPSSRVRRAMSWLYCAPKSRMKTVGCVTAPASGGSGCRLQRRIVIRLLADFGHDLNVRDVPVFSDDDDGTRQQAQLGDQQSVVTSEAAIAVVRQHPKLHAAVLRASPARHRKRKIHAYDPGVHARRKFTEALVEFLR